MTLWLGIDPGGNQSGVCLRDGRRPLTHAVITRDPNVDIHPSVYLGAVVGYASMLRTAWGADVVHVAVEGLNPPNPHLGMTNVSHLLATAVVLGAVLQRFPDVTVVPPGRHGGLVLGMYPGELVSDGERRVKGWRARVGKSADIRHARSAYDVAGAAPGHARLHSAVRSIR